MAKKAAKKAGKKISKKKATRKKGPGSARAFDPAVDLPEAEPMYPPPKPLDAVVGQTGAIGVLRASLESERLHHAWIFHGPAGVGKFTTALAFAAMLLDPTLDRDLGGNLAPDPGSETQRLLRGRRHPDLHVVRKELARYSDDKKIRDAKLITIPKDVVDTHLIDPATRAPNMPGGLAGKVFIVDEAERLDRSLTNAPTQNAILKTLEEPPERTVIILVTSSEDRLLPTIRSRCQRVAFAPLSTGDTLAVVRGLGLDLPEPDAARAADLADGSPGRLLELVETGVLRWEDQLRPLLDEAARGRFKPSLGKTMKDLVDGWAKARAEALPNGSKEVANREAAARMFELIAARARRGLAHPRGTARALGWIEAIQHAETRLHANVQLAAVFEGLAADLAGDQPPQASRLSGARPSPGEDG